MRRLQDRGVIPPDRAPDAYATTLLAVVQGGLLLGQAKRSTEPLHTALHTMIDLIAHPAG